MWSRDAYLVPCSFQAIKFADLVSLIILGMLAWIWQMDMDALEELCDEIVVAGLCAG